MLRKIRTKNKKDEIWNKYSSYYFSYNFFECSIMTNLKSDVVLLRKEVQKLKSRKGESALNVDNVINEMQECQKIPYYCLIILSLTNQVDP